MDELIKMRIQNLIALRQMTAQILTVLGGGVIGLFFLPNSILKFIFLPFGIFFVTKLFISLAKTKEELQSYLYKTK